MRNAVLFQINIMFRKKNFQLAFLVMMGFSILAFIYTSMQQINSEQELLFSADALFCGNYYAPLWHYFSYIFVFVVALPYSMSYFSDKECGVLVALLCRINRLQYHISAMITCFIGNFLIIFFPFLLNLLLCHITFPENTNFLFGQRGTENFVSAVLGNTLIFSTENPTIPFLSLFLNNSAIYNVWYILLLSIMSGILGVFLLSLSRLWIKSRAILFLPIFFGLQMSSLATAYSYNRAIENSEVYFTNYTIMDYFAVAGYPGQSFMYLFIVVIGLLLFSAASLMVVLLRDEFVGGGLGYGKNRRKTVC